jgi:hypothetical protein
MIKPARYLLTDWFWHVYFNFILKADFKELRYNQDVGISQNKALLVLGNHFSWWDGFILFRLNELYFRKRLHLMMLENQLSKNSFLRYAGAYSINRQGRKILESLHYTSGLLENPQNLVIIFPQGKIESMHAPHIYFEKGIKRILEGCRKEVQIVFSTALVDYYAHRKPTLHFYLKEYAYQPSSTLEDIEEAYNAHYQDALQKQRMTYAV